MWLNFHIRMTLNNMIAKKREDVESFRSSVQETLKRATVKFEALQHCYRTFTRRPPIAKKLPCIHTDR